MNRKPRAESLGVSNGYVLLRYPNGTLYMIGPPEQQATKATDLPQVQTMTTH